MISRLGCAEAGSKNRWKAEALLAVGTAQVPVGRHGTGTGCNSLLLALFPLIPILSLPAPVFFHLCPCI